MLPLAFLLTLAQYPAAAPAGELRAPASNPLTREKVELGRRLFSESALSRDGSVSCATCHDPRLAFSDNRPVARGIFGRLGPRNTPTLINRGSGDPQFWDGRAAGLEQQVLEPIHNPKEMDLAVVDALARLPGRGYERIGPANLAAALSSYVRTIRSSDAPYDRLLAGEQGAMSEEAFLGLNLFNDKANCYICHGGRNFTDEAFHNTGVAWRDGRLADEGRFSITSKVYHHGAFKTPTLREVARTAPYMHDGSLATLEDVVEFYDRGGNRNPWLDEQVRPLNLTGREKRALAAFLRALSGTVRDGM